MGRLHPVGAGRPVQGLWLWGSPCVFWAEKGHDLPHFNRITLAPVLRIDKRELVNPVVIIITIIISNNNSNTTYSYRTCVWPSTTHLIFIIQLKFHDSPIQREGLNVPILYLRRLAQPKSESQTHTLPSLALLTCPALSLTPLTSYYPHLQPHRTVPFPQLQTTFQASERFSHALPAA